MTPRKCNCYNEPGLCDFCLATLRARLAESEAEVGRLVKRIAEDRGAVDKRLEREVARAERAEAERDDLLGALKLLLLHHDDRCPCGGKGMGAASRARAAIAKVGGP